MTDTYEIRPLTPTDAGAYKLLRDDMLTLHPTAFTSDAAFEQSRSAKSYAGRLGTNANCFTLGAWRDDALLGAVSCERDPRVKVRHVAHVIGLMVKSTFEHRGIGRALVAVCLDHLRQAGGLDSVTLSVTSNNRRAIDLYGHAGFRRYGTLPRAVCVDGRFYDKDLMVLVLA